MFNLKLNFILLSLYILSMFAHSSSKNDLYRAVCMYFCPKRSYLCVSFSQDPLKKGKKDLF